MRTQLKAQLGIGFATATAAAMIASAAPAAASTTPSSSKGNSTFSITNKTARKIIGGCGDSTVTVGLIGDASGSINPRNLKITLPVTGLVTSDTGNIRIEHAGSGFELSNSCYDIKFTNFYIQDLGDGGSDSGFDVLARNFNDLDENGKPRETDFTLDLTDANVSTKGKTTKVRSADLLLADQGAIEFNRLSGDPTGATGPFSTGDEIGKARTFYRNPA